MMEVVVEPQSIFDRAIDYHFETAVTTNHNILFPKALYMAQPRVIIGQLVMREEVFWMELLYIHGENQLYSPTHHHRPRDGSWRQ